MSHNSWISLITNISASTQFLKSSLILHFLIYHWTGNLCTDNTWSWLYTICPPSLSQPVFEEIILFNGPAIVMTSFSDASIRRVTSADPALRITLYREFPSNLCAFFIGHSHLRGSCDCSKCLAQYTNIRTQVYCFFTFTNQLVKYLFHAIPSINKISVMKKILNTSLFSEWHFQDSSHFKYMSLGDDNANLNPEKS